MGNFAVWLLFFGMYDIINRVYAVGVRRYTRIIDVQE